MRTVIQPIRHLRSMRVSNVFLLDGGAGDRWLIDTGHVAERMTLLLELRSAGLGPRDLTGVLLTHRHSDHAGNAAFLQRQGVMIYAHELDAQVLAGAQPRPPLMRGDGSFIAGLFARVENRFPAASLTVDRALRDGDTAAGMEVHWVPGHTDGSVFYRHEPTLALMSGDTLLTAHPPLTLRTGLATPYPSFTTSMERAHASIQAFHDKGVEYSNLLAGHGPPLLGSARAKVLQFLETTRR
jgi:glyoxylase-like metal-dependent hydrolase (beta-lactamase superfamily II)